MCFVKDQQDTFFLGSDKKVQFADVDDDGNMSDGEKGDDVTSTNSV